MVDRNRLLLILSLGLCACGSERPLLLDQICRGQSVAGTGTPNCQLGGDAEQITGITADSTAVRLGPEGGSLRVLISAVNTAQFSSSWSLDVLAASNRPEGSTLYRSLTWGSCGAQCPPDPGDVEAALDEDFQWAEVLVDEAGLSTPGFLIPDDAVITLRGSDIDIVDLRTPGYDPDQDFATR